MNRQTLLTAVIFTVVGFLGGYIYHAQTSFQVRGQMGQLEPGDVPSTTPGAPRSPGGMPPAPEAAPTMEQIGQMLAELKQQAAANPKDPQPVITLGNLYFDANKHAEAVEWYGKALAVDPKNVHVRTDLGTSLYNLGRFDEALKEFRRALQYDPNHPQTLFNIAITELVGKNDIGGAEEALRRLKRLNPGFPGIPQLEARIGQIRQERTRPNASSNPRP